MRNRRLIAATAALGLVATVVPVTVGLASASGATTPAKVDITVSLDLPNGSGSSGPKVFEREGAPPGAGVELDAKDLKSTPSDGWGSLTVDIAPATKHVTVAPDQACDFQTADLTIAGGGYT